MEKNTANNTVIIAHQNLTTFSLVEASEMKKCWCDLKYLFSIESEKRREFVSSWSRWSYIADSFLVRCFSRRVSKEFKNCLSKPTFLDRNQEEVHRQTKREFMLRFKLKKKSCFGVRFVRNLINFPQINSIIFVVHRCCVLCSRQICFRRRQQWWWFDFSVANAHFAVYRLSWELKMRRTSTLKIKVHWPKTIQVYFKLCSGMMQCAV